MSDSKNIELQKKIQKHRIEIDKIDAQIVKLLNNRAISATKIGYIKRDHNVPVYVPSREEDVIKNVQEVNQGPLSNNALKRLFERIIDESRRLERETTHKD